jgi:hypothetical protein
MTREFSDEQLSAYLDGQLSADERTAVEAQLAADPASRQLLGELRAVSGQVKSLPTYSADRGFADRVVQAALAAKAARGAPVALPSRSRRTWLVVALAGVASVAAALAIMAWSPTGPTPSQSPLERSLAELRQSLPAEGEAVVLRIRLPAGVAPNQAIDMALASAGIGQRSPADLSTGAIEVGAAYRKQLADKFGGQKPGVPNTALSEATTTAEDAVFVDATWEHLEQAVKELAVLSDSPFEISSLAKVAAARPAGSARTGGEGEDPGIGSKASAAQGFAQRLPARMYRLEKSAASPAAPSTSVPASAPKKVRVLILVEVAAK